MVFSTSPVRRPRFSRRGVSELVGMLMVTSSRKIAMPWIGSLHRGPWAVASWKA